MNSYLREFEVQRLCAAHLDDQFFGLITGLTTYRIRIYQLLLSSLFPLNPKGILIIVSPIHSTSHLCI